MTAETPSRPGLDLGEIPAAASNFLSRLRFQRLFASAPHLRGESAAEIRDLDRRHLELINRHGLGEVLELYGEELMPAASQLPAGTERWRLWFELGCRRVALQAAAGADRELVEQVERLHAELLGARFAVDPQEDREARRQVRAFLASQSAGAAERLRWSGHTTEALRAYAVLDRLGVASPAQQAAHARLRWHCADRSLDAVRIYLRARDGRDTAHNPAFAEIDRFLAERLTVDEESPRDGLAERLFLNQLALCSTRPQVPAWRNTGLAYLLLHQPARALPYLERACSVNGADGGASAFYLGQARFHTEDYPGSAAAFESSIAHGYSPVRIAAWLGLAYARIQQWERALTTFQKAEPEAAGEQAGELYLSWGRASFMVGDVADSLLRFTRAAAEQTDPRAGYGLALCHESLGEQAQARAELQRVLARFPRFAPAAHRLGMHLAAAGDPAAALSPLRLAVELSPQDPEYHLSLGLALEQMSAPEALPHLESAAEAGAGGPEILRRLALLLLQQGDRQRARRWLDALAAAEPATPAVTRFRARDLASQATEAFNAGRYPEAVALWEQVAAERPEEPTVAERLALALVRDAEIRIREGELAGLGERVERASELSPEAAECRYLAAITRLLAADFATAAGALRGLTGELPDRPEVELLGVVSAVLSGDEEAEGRLTGLSAGSPAALLGLLRVLRAAFAGRFEEAAESCEAWLRDSGASRASLLSRDLLNTLVGTIKVRGTRRRRQQSIRFLEGLDARDGNGSWALALALARHLLATEKGLTRAGEADPEELAACQAAYRTLLDGSDGGTTAEARRSLTEHSARLLVFMTCHHAQRGRLASALATLDELQSLPCPVPAMIRDLESLLRRRLARPSHEKAFALLEEDPEAARQTWEALLLQNPGDLEARHHLACLAWSRAYDEVLAQRIEDSVPYWREGLEHYRQLYARESYWNAQREKGQALGTSTAYPFDAAAFDQWRRDAIYQRATTLLHLTFRILAGADLAEALDADVLRAKAFMDLLRGSKLDEATRQRLAGDLADHYLDPDPTRVPDFARSRRRAEIVLDVDPANLTARTFLLRSLSYEVSTRSEEGDENFSGMVQQLTAVERHAEWLEEHRRNLPVEHRGSVERTLAAFYDQLGMTRHREGQLAVQSFNTRQSASVSEKRRLLEKILQAYRESDRWFGKSLALDPVNAQAKEIPESHRNQYQPIERMLREIPRI